jgi:PAS domain S-box-containing protein
MDTDPIILADRTGVIRFWSEAATAAFGYGADEALGRTLDLIVPPDYREAHWNGFRRAVESGAAEVEGQAVPFPVRHADGKIAERPGRLSLIRRPEGGVVGALVVFGG